MAKYLRPRRGTKTNAVGQNILLKRGEIFLEFPDSIIGNTAGRIIVGDESTSYSSIKPFIEDPSLYIPQLLEPTIVGSNISECIDYMGDGSGASTTTLPNIFAQTHSALTIAKNEINSNYNAATAKAGTSVFTSSAKGLCKQLAGGTTKYLRADVSWQIPPNDNTTYDRATTDSNGLLIKLQNDTTKYLRASGSWQVPPDTTYGAPTTTNYGLVPQLPGDATTATKYLRSDGTWQVPPNDNTTYVLTSVNSGNSTTQVANKTSAYNAYKDIRNNLFKTKNLNAQIASVPANGLGSTWAACTMSGYHPIAIIQFNTKSTVLCLCTCQLETRNNVYGVYLAVRNLSSARTGNIFVKVLFERDAIS